MKRSITLIMLFTLAAGELWAKNHALKKYTPAAIDSCERKEPRKIVVFLYTDWCTFCHAMEQTTFKNKEIIDILNEAFYFMPFNGEQRADARFYGQTFKYRPNGDGTGVHGLAESLSHKSGQISYPSLVILDERYNVIAQCSQFLNAGELKNILKAALRTSEIEASPIR